MGKIFLGPGAVVFFWLLVTLAEMNTRIPIASGFSGQFMTDNDSYMHLVRALGGDWWGRGGWTDRVNAPFGTVIHWTYPYDFLLTILHAPLKWWISDEKISLSFAGAWSSAIPCLLAMLALYKFGCHLRDRAAGIALAMLYIGGPVVLGYSNIGRADHHSLTMMVTIFFLVATYFQTIQPRVRQAILTGFIGGWALWTAPETVPAIVAAIGLLLWWRWLRAQDMIQSDWLIGGTMTGIAMIGLWLDPPYDGLWSPDTDRLSIVFVVFCFFITLYVRFLRTSILQTESRLMRLFYLGGIGLIAGGSWLGLFPNALSGPIGQMSVFLQAKWLPHILEMRPIQTVWRAITYLTPCIIGILSTIIIIQNHAHHQRTTDAWFWRGCLAIIILALIGSIIASRFSHFSVIAGIVPTILVWRDFHCSSLGVRFFVFLFLFSLPALLSTTLKKANQLFSLSFDAEIVNEAYCGSLDPVLPLLITETQKNGTTIVMASQNLGSKILWTTTNKVVAAPFHRNDQGIMDESIFANNADMTIVNQIANRRKVGLAIVCLNDAPKDSTKTTPKPIPAIQQLANGTMTSPLWQILAPPNKKMVILRYHPPVAAAP
jgi:hypothetical protein